jgi:putative FmdB family regulatory protein
MPTYEYRCPEGHEFEKFYRTISGAPTAVNCPTCGALAERQLSGGAGLLFKGSGFYLTDYGKNAHATKGPKPATSETAKGESTGSSAGETKSSTDSSSPAAAPASGSGQSSGGGKSESGGSTGGKSSSGGSSSGGSASGGSSSGGSSSGGSSSGGGAGKSSRE